MAKAKSVSAVAELLACQFPSVKKKSWYERLDPEVRDSMDAIREAWHAGKLEHVGNMRQIFEWCKAKYSLPIKFSAFRYWIAGHEG